MKIIFLGTNGWFDSPAGNTISTLIDTKDAYIVFDAGFGLTKLRKYAKKDKPIYLFLSHLHFDHICGLHTLPMFNFKKGITIFISKKSLKELATVIKHPFMSSLGDLEYPVKVIGFDEGNHKNPFPFTCKPLKHIDNTLGFRISIENKIITYCCDTAVCDNDLDLSRNADLLIHECAFLPGEKSYWGHTNPESAANLAKTAGVKKLALTHFGANNYTSLQARNASLKEAKKIFPKTIAAKDNLTLHL